MKWDNAWIVKGEFLVKGVTPEGAPVHLEIQQVFMNYNERIRVDPPPWVNVGPAAEGGKFVILNTKVPRLRHYR